MVSFRTMAEKMTKQELMTWAEQRLNLALTKNMTKIEMESQIMSGARKQGVKINNIKTDSTLSVLNSK